MSISHPAQDRATDKEAVPALYFILASSIWLLLQQWEGQMNSFPAFSSPKYNRAPHPAEGHPHIPQTQHHCDHFCSCLHHPPQMKLIQLHLPPYCCSREASREWDTALGKGMTSQLSSCPSTPHSPTDLFECLKPTRAITQPCLHQTL